MMLGHYEFSFLTRSEQTSYILAKGTYLATRYEDAYLINLYDFRTFFAETKLDACHNLVREITTFTSTVGLNPYLASINLLL